MADTVKITYNGVPLQADLVVVAAGGGSDASAANQVTGNASLATIATNTGAATPAGTNEIGKVAAPDIITCTTSITRPANATAYAAGQAFADSTSAPTTGGFTLTGAARGTGKSSILSDLVIVNSNPAATPLQGALMIFDSAVTAVNDGSALAFSDAEALTLVAAVPFTMVAGVNNNYVHVQNAAIAVTTVGSANLRFLVKVTNAYTPASAEILTVRAKFIPVG